MKQNFDVKKDRLRYTKNSSSATLAYLAILFNVLYFVSVYSYNEHSGRFYYNMTIGFSVVANLLFLLISFLASEGVKNYKLGYCIAFIPLGAFQLLRIVGIPMSAHDHTIILDDEMTQVMNDAQFYYVCACLCLSALACFAVAFTGIRKTIILREYEKSLIEQ